MLNAERDELIGSFAAEKAALKKGHNEALRVKDEKHDKTTMELRVKLTKTKRKHKEERRRAEDEKAAREQLVLERNQERDESTRQKQRLEDAVTELSTRNKNLESTKGEIERSLKEKIEENQTLHTEIRTTRIELKTV